MENFATCGGTTPGFASEVVGSDVPQDRAPACAGLPGSLPAPAGGQMRRPSSAGLHAMPEI
jgi:hypothetical protein